MRVLIILFMFIMVGCKQFSNNRRNTLIYNIDYDYQGTERLKEDKYRYLVSDDTLYIYLETSFKNELVKIKEGNTLVYDNNVMTNEVIGLADVVKIGNINQINNIEISIGKQPWVAIEVKNVEHNLVGISMLNDTVDVVFYKSVRSYE